MQSLTNQKLKIKNRAAIFDFGFWILWPTAFWIFICGSPPFNAVAQDLPTDYQVKAAYLFHFGQFVQWPDQDAELSMAGSQSNQESGKIGAIVHDETPAPAESQKTETGNQPFVIGVFGRDDPFHGDLEPMVARVKINGHRIEVRRIRALDDLHGCRVLFIPAAERERQREVLDAVRGKPVLTVGDAADFYAAGGMIQFVEEQAQVHFRINADAARAAGLKISSKLLSLAKP